MEEDWSRRMQSGGQQRETAAAVQVEEMRREAATNLHPLLLSSGGGNINETSKISSLSRTSNADINSSSLSPSATLRRPPSLTRNFGLSKDDDNEKVIDDPLLSTSSLHDPLSSEDTLGFTPRASRRTAKSASDERAEAAAAEWDGYKASIMQRFTSSGTITVSTNFDIISKEPKGRGKSVTAAHLQVLEDPEKEAREEVTIISQQEYVTRLKALNEEISQAWLNNERVSALRLSIKVARLLSDSSVPQFYPTLFVLVTDVLDTVGNLVWNRIKKKSESDDDGTVVAHLPVNFTADDIRQEAKDTCQNWFYRIGSVKELLPRIYLELAILRCVYFLEKDPPVATFQRLTMMIRGVTDPLASAYIRLYLARRLQAILPAEIGSSESLKRYSALLHSLELPMPSSIPKSPRVCLIEGVKDYLVLFRRVLAGEFESKYMKAGVDLRLYVMLVEPVIDWVIHCIFKHANQEDMISIFNAFGEAHYDDRLSDAETGFEDSSHLVSVVVYYLLKNLPGTFVGNDSLNISKMVRSSADLSMPQYMNYRLLGLKLCECSPPREFRLTVLNDIWRVVLRYTDLTEYLSVADVFVEYILQNCSEVELGVIFRDIIKHVRKADVSDGVLVSLESIVFKLVTHYTDLSHVLTLAHFMDILDLLHGDTRISVYKRMLSGVSRRQQQVQDPVTRHFGFEAAKVLHDSLDSMSSDDDRRQITNLIIRFVQLVDFGRDLEQNLAFLVDCRGTFADMDPLRVTVVHASNRIAMTTLKMVRGSHAKRTIEFVKACLTFNEITIPSINSVLVRSNLFLETAEVALMNALPSHAEGLVKSALTCLQDITSKDDLKVGEIEVGVSSFLRKLSAFLLVVPGHPELGAFYIVKGLVNLLDSHPWLTQRRRRVQIFCSMLSMLGALGQDHLPYHIQNTHLDSNDLLYYGDTQYKQELESLMDSILGKVIVSVNEDADPAQRGIEALDACNVLLQVFDVTRVGDACLDLLAKASSLQSSHHPYFQKTLDFCTRKGLQDPKV
ncbi:unnamed protein product [Calypogeia fissa]